MIRLRLLLFSSVLLFTAALECDAESNPCHDTSVMRSRKRDICIEDIELKIGNWQSVPFGEQQPPCFYRLSSESKVSAGVTIHIEARVKRGKATVFIGTASNVREQNMKKLSLDVTGLDRDIYERIMSATRTIYIGVETLADTECEIKYEYVRASQPSKNLKAEQTQKAPEETNSTETVAIIIGAAAAVFTIFGTAVGFVLKILKRRQAAKENKENNKEPKVAPHSPEGSAGPTSRATIAYPNRLTPKPTARTTRNIELAWQKNDHKIARALLSSFQSDWPSCAGVRLGVVACDSNIVHVSGKDAQQQQQQQQQQKQTFYDVGVAPIAPSEPREEDLSVSKQFNTTVGLSSLQKFDVVNFPNGTVALKPHDSKSKSRNQRSIEANEHGLVQLSRAHPGDASDKDASINIFEPISFGRIPRNDIVCNSDYLSVSGRHAEFEFAFVKEGWSFAGVPKSSGKLQVRIKDLDSTQGTNLFVRDDRDQVYLKELTQGQAYRIDWPPPLRSSGVFSVPSHLVRDEHKATYGLCTGTKVGPRLQVIGLQMGTVVFAFQSTKQHYAWDYVEPERDIIRPMTSERAPLPCVNEYLDYFFEENDYVRLL